MYTLYILYITHGVHPGVNVSSIPLDFCRLLRFAMHPVNV